MLGVRESKAYVHGRQAPPHRGRWIASPYHTDVAQTGKQLDGGSIYWVIKRFIQCRQRILRLDEVIGGDGIRRCAIVLDPELILTTQVPRRPFQGWRYLKAEDAARPQ